MLYSEKVMDHFTHPRNLGKMDDADGVGEVGNAKCGDIMKIYIKVENDVITDVRANTFGCVALPLPLPPWPRGVVRQTHFEALGCPTRLWWRPWTQAACPALHCSVLAEEAVRAAVKDYYDRNGIPCRQEKFAENCAACHEGACHCS